MRFFHNVLPPGPPGELVARADGRGPIASEVPFLRTEKNEPTREAFRICSFFFSKVETLEMDLLEKTVWACKE